jgi:hypothetical protein
VCLDAVERSVKIKRQEATIERTSTSGESRIFGLVREEGDALLCRSCGLTLLAVDEVGTRLRSETSTMLVSHRGVRPQGGRGGMKDGHWTLEWRRFSPSYKVLDDYFGAEVVLVENALRSFVQVTSRVSGRTRVSATTVMKLVSPLHLGRA